MVRFIRREIATCLGHKAKGNPQGSIGYYSGTLSPTVGREQFEHDCNSRENRGSLGIVVLEA